MFLFLNERNFVIVPQFHTTQFKWFKLRLNIFWAVSDLLEDDLFLIWRLLNVLNEQLMSSILINEVGMRSI